MLSAIEPNDGGSAMHTDPVCGMSVEPTTAAAAWDHDGTTYYFCSVGCMERFRQDPARVLAVGPDERSM
jgi:Cu+-exporting ATPase